MIYPDRLGTHTKETQKEECFTTQQYMPPSRSVDVWTGSEYNGTVSEATVFLSHLYVKTIFLPRQARDKHRENSKNEYTVFSQAEHTFPVPVSLANYSRYQKDAGGNVQMFTQAPSGFDNETAVRERCHSNFPIWIVWNSRSYY